MHIKYSNVFKLLLLFGLALTVLSPALSNLLDLPRLDSNEKNSLAYRPYRVYRLAGVDIGQVKPYSAVIVNKDETNLKASLVSKELTASKETKLINSKLGRVKEHLSSIYNKINVYENIIKNNKNQEFTNQKIGRAHV